jgi:hypothetical protein
MILTHIYYENKSDTVEINDSDYTSEPNSNSNSSECSSITIEERTYQYWPDHDYNQGRIIDFEYDSTGNFPSSYSTSSKSQSTHHQSTQSAGYATQSDYNDDYPYFDSRLDLVTGRYNPQYWRHINGHTYDLRHLFLQINMIILNSVSIGTRTNINTTDKFKFSHNSQYFPTKFSDKFFTSILLSNSSYFPPLLIH